MKRRLILLIFILTFISSINAQIDDAVVKISILTCSPGSELYSIYGHNAIRVRNESEGTDVVYNYGTFDFNTPGFTLKFLRGKLLYKLDASDYSQFIEEYNYWERSVSEQELSLDSMQKVKVMDALYLNMQGANRFYKYDFFMDNCATRLRDIIDNNAGSLNWPEEKASGKTFRQIIKEYQKQMPWTDLGIDLIIGARADRKTTMKEETFIPDYLADDLMKIHFNNDKGSALVKQRVEILSFPKEPNRVGVLSFLLSPAFFFLLLLLGEINILARALRGNISNWVKRYDNLWMIVIAFSCMLMLFMWFGTDHQPTKDNWNLLWCNPFILLWWWKKGNSTILNKILVAFLSGCMILSVINSFPGWQILPQQFNPVVILIIAVLVIKLWRINTVLSSDRNR